jgi:hypothetical protein
VSEPLDGDGVGGGALQEAAVPAQHLLRGVARQREEAGGSVDNRVVRKRGVLRGRRVGVSIIIIIIIIIISTLLIIIPSRPTKHNASP